MNDNKPNDPVKSADPLETIKNFKNMSSLEIGEKLFQWRDYTPVPLIFILFFIAEPKVLSATIGTLVILFGEFIRIYSVAFIGTVSRTRSESTGGNVVRKGPYALVRNPLYIGNFFIVLGILFYSAVPWFSMIVMIAFAIQYYYIVKYEESLLLKKFGPEYQKYLNEVPAWLPAKLPALSDIPMPESIWPALKSEKRTLTAIIVIVFCLAIIAG